MRAKAVRISPDCLSIHNVNTIKSKKVTEILNFFHIFLLYTTKRPREGKKRLTKRRTDSKIKAR